VKYDGRKRDPNISICGAMDWITKTDPEKHPVRFLASIWQQRMQTNFQLSVSLSSKEMGQLKTLRLHLGDLTEDVIEWMLDKVHWWQFCQQIKAESKDHLITEQPDIGLALLRRGSLLRAIRSQPQNTDSDLVKRIDEREYQQIRGLLLTFAEGKPERLAEIEAAKTLSDLKKLLNEMMEENTGDSTE